MYKACCCILLAGLSLCGQTPQATVQLNPTLTMALVNAGVPGDVWSQRLADGMMALASDGRRPTRSEVSDFTSALTGVLAGKRIDNAQIAILQQCLVDVLRRAGVSNFALARQLRETLTALHVDDPKADLITRRFLVIGEAVRGPDDAPVSPKINLVLPPRTK